MIIIAFILIAAIPHSSNQWITSLLLLSSSSIIAMWIKHLFAQIGNNQMLIFKRVNKKQ